MANGNGNKIDWLNWIRTIVVVGSVLIGLITFLVKTNDTVALQEKHLEYIDSRLDQIDNRLNTMQDGVSYVKRSLRSHGIKPRGDDN